MPVRAISKMENIFEGILNRFEMGLSVEAYKSPDNTAMNMPEFL